MFKSLEKIKKLLNNKQIILVSNHNINNKPHRINLINIIKQFAKAHDNIKFWNPTKLIKKEGINKCLRDENHFTEHFKKLQSENILRLINE